MFETLPEKPARRTLELSDALTRFLRSRGCQAAGVAVIFALLAVHHWGNDGLWLQGDAPRHAVNGLFWWDLLRAHPADPVDFAIRYYARYPVINPASYPPLFYILEGLVFAAIGPSPHAARILVLLFAGLGGFYTMAWARRWISPAAGWAGLFLAFVPGVVLWSNAVMLNIPAMSLSLGALYHFRRWSETGRFPELGLTGLWLGMVLVTYYPAAVVMGICAGWLLLPARAFRWDRRLLWIAAGALAFSIPVVISLWLAPVHTVRHLPRAEFLTRSTTWTFYWRALPDIVGWGALGLGGMGLAAAALTRQWREEAARLVMWIVIPIVGLTLVPAHDRRYILLLAPAFVIAAAIGVAECVRARLSRRPVSQAAILAVGLALGCWSASRVQVPRVSGFLELASFLEQHAAADAVLYEGRYAGLFGFYFRALDPGFERRLVRADKFLYERFPTTTFKRIEKLNAASPADVVRLVRASSGCRWVAFEVSHEPDVARGRQILREALTRPEFELVRSFPISGAFAQRVDLYRVTIPVDPVTTVDLEFPAFNNRSFSGVVPISRD